MSYRFIERPRSFCALGGALLTAEALPGVVPILHTSAGCGGSVYWTQIGSTGYLGAGYCGGLAVPSSNVEEKHIIFGGAERLHEQIENTLQLVEGELYIVLSGCMTDIIGDDIHSVLAPFRDSGKQIIGAETGGFKGDAYKGYDLVLQALFKDYVLPQNEKIKGKVNLWGIVPGQDAFWRGNLSILRQLLEKLGLEVNSFFTNQDSLEELRNAAQAELNILVSTTHGIEAAQLFEELHGVPYISTTLPIGFQATGDFLKTIGARLNLETAMVKQFIASEEKQYYSFVERIADSYNDLEMQRYAVVVGDGDYAPALCKFLADDLGWLPALTVITEELTDTQKVAAASCLNSLSSKYKTHLVYESDASEIQYHLAKIWPRNKGQKFYDAFSPAFVVGSHLERELAKNIGAGHLTVTYPVGNRVVLSRGYTGYEGSLSLIEDLFSVLVAER